MQTSQVCGTGILPVGAWARCPSHGLRLRLSSLKSDPTNPFPGVKKAVTMDRDRSPNPCGLAGRSSAGPLAHDAGHGQGGLGGFGAAVVGLAQAPGAGLLLVFQEQDLVDDGDEVSKLDGHEGTADGLADVGGMDGLAAQDDAQADDGGRGPVACLAGDIGAGGAGQAGGDDRDLKGAGHAEDLGAPGASATLTGSPAAIAGGTASCVAAANMTVGSYQVTALGATASAFRTALVGWNRGVSAGEDLVATTARAL